MFEAELVSNSRYKITKAENSLKVKLCRVSETLEKAFRECRQ